MNQTEQMREALQTYLDAGLGEHADAVLQLHAKKLAEKALAAEPAKLVRLTDDRIRYIDEQTPGGLIDFANAIMDAMIAKNGGSA